MFIYLPKFWAYITKYVSPVSNAPNFTPFPVKCVSSATISMVEPFIQTLFPFSSIRVAENRRIGFQFVGKVALVSVGVLLCRLAWSVLGVGAQLQAQGVAWIMLLCEVFSAVMMILGTLRIYRQGMRPSRLAPWWPKCLDSECNWCLYAYGQAFEG